MKAKAQPKATPRHAGDLSPRKYQQMEALRALAGGIVHDFNNILAGIIGFTDLALEQAEPQTDLHENLSTIMADARRAAELVRQILAFSHNKGENRRPIQLSLLAKAILRLMRPEFPPAVDIQQMLSTETMLVLADITQIHQVLVNMFVWAKASLGASGGVMRMELDPICVTDEQKEVFPLLAAGDYVRLRLKIVSAEGTKLLKQNDFSRSRWAGGHAKSSAAPAEIDEIVTKLGGMLVFDRLSDHEALGSLFLPQHGQAPVIPVERLPVDVIGQGEQVMLVDDEPNVIMMEGRMLEGLGFRVNGFMDSRLALEEINQNPQKYALVITDYSMPFLNGAQLAQKIRVVSPRVSMILCSGVSEKELLRRARESHIDICLKKPFTKSMMAEAITKALKGPGKNKMNI